MSLSGTVSAERVHISFFGMRNAGKSSVVNAFTGQKISLVSDVKGTTTDPVRKAMELLPMGPVMIIDTPGIDDEGKLGEMRVARSLEVLRQTDVAILVVDAIKGLQDGDMKLATAFEEKKLPYIIVYNKADLLPGYPEPLSAAPKQGLNPAGTIMVSAEDGWHIHQLKEMVAHLAKTQEKEKHLVADLINPGDTVILVIPIDKSAPKGRLILPQQQTIRDILEARAVSMICGVDELPQTIQSLKNPPALVITDSQAFKEVAERVPQDIPLTSFSILMARWKGSLTAAAEGAFALDHIKTGDKILISEGCTHHRQCEDIGTVKLPALIKRHTGSEPEFHFTSGREFPDDLSEFSLVIHCGGCMLNDKEMEYRNAHAAECGIPMTNYGIAIAHMNGILQRSIAPLGM